MKNIIITGGGFANKGAQAMTFITIAELHQRYPNHQILLLTTETIKKTDLGVVSDYVSVLGWHPMKFAKAQANPGLKLLCNILNRNEYRETVSVYKNCDLMVDISGFALGSDWPDKICSDYLDNFEYSKYFQIPLVLMPQSFGPFTYPENSIVLQRASDLLPYAHIICAREQEGYDLLISKFGLKNVVLKPDLVLNSRIDLYQALAADCCVPEIGSNSIGIIPNENVVRILGMDKLISLYTEIINHVLDLGIGVYLISHSDNDAQLCERIKDQFIDNDSVINLTNDFSCIEFSEIVKKFRFCIASRFHSIVHSYKNGAPCVALGWADKYYELMKTFNQETYEFDIREDYSSTNIKNRIDDMIQNIEQEKNRIVIHLSEIQKDNVFDVLPKRI